MSAKSLATDLPYGHDVTDLHGLEKKIGEICGKVLEFPVTSSQCFFGNYGRAKKAKAKILMRMARMGEFCKFS
jgi:hypothetical protein